MTTTDTRIADPIEEATTAHATGAGMEWWGVSDVSADVLAALVARLAHGE